MSLKNRFEERNPAETKEEQPQSMTAFGLIDCTKLDLAKRESPKDHSIPKCIVDDDSICFLPPELMIEEAGDLRRREKTAKDSADLDLGPSRRNKVKEAEAMKTLEMAGIVTPIEKTEDMKGLAFSTTIAATTGKFGAAYNTVNSGCDGTLVIPFINPTPFSIPLPAVEHPDVTDARREAQRKQQATVHWYNSLSTEEKLAADLGVLANRRPSGINEARYARSFEFAGELDLFSFRVNQEAERLNKEKGELSPLGLEILCAITMDKVAWNTQNMHANELAVEHVFRAMNELQKKDPTGTVYRAQIETLCEIAIRNTDMHNPSKRAEVLAKLDVIAEKQLDHLLDWSYLRKDDSPALVLYSQIRLLAADSTKKDLKGQQHYFEQLNEARERLQGKETPRMIELKHAEQQERDQREQAAKQAKVDSQKREYEDDRRQAAPSEADQIRKEFIEPALQLLATPEGREQAKSKQFADELMRQTQQIANLRNADLAADAICTVLKIAEDSQNPHLNSKELEHIRLMAIGVIIESTTDRDKRIEEVATSLLDSKNEAVAKIARERIIGVIEREYVALRESNGDGKNTARLSQRTNQWKTYANELSELSRDEYWKQYWAHQALFVEYRQHAEVLRENVKPIGPFEYQRKGPEPKPF